MATMMIRMIIRQRILFNDLNLTVVSVMLLLLLFLLFAGNRYHETKTRNLIHNQIISIKNIKTTQTKSNIKNNENFFFFFL